MYQLHVLEYVAEFGDTYDDIARAIGQRLERGRPLPRTDWQRTYVSRLDVTDYDAVVRIYGTPYYAAITDTHVHVFIDGTDLTHDEIMAEIYA